MGGWGRKSNVHQVLQFTSQMTAAGANSDSGVGKSLNSGQVSAPVSQHEPFSGAARKKQFDQHQRSVVGCSQGSSSQPTAILLPRGLASNLSREIRVLG